MGVCWICGEPDHRWPRCNRKKAKGCALCGSGAHQIRQCAQRKGWRSQQSQHPFTPPGGENQALPEMAARVCWAEKYGTEAEGTWGEEGGDRDAKEDEVGVSAWMAAPSFDVENSEVPRENGEPELREGMPLQAFRAAVEGGSGPRLEVVPETRGVSPLSDPGESGKLEYPIELDRYRTRALLDHRASASFMSEELREKLDLPRLPLHRPAFLIEFSAKGPRLDHSVRLGRVCFAGLRRPWSFVLMRVPPSPIVIGLDMIRVWQLCYNPLDDRVYSLTSTDAHVILAEPSSTRSKCSTSDDPCFEIVESEADEEVNEVVCVDAYEGRHQERKKAVSMEVGVPGEIGVVVRCRTVTASTQEEVEQGKQVLASLDERIARIAEEFRPVFQAPDAIPPSTLSHAHHPIDSSYCPYKASSVPYWGRETQNHSRASSGAGREGLGYPVGVTVGSTGSVCQEERGCVEALY